MMGCPATPPQTLGEFVSLIERCALTHGGANWQYTALLGLVGVLVIVATVAVALLAFRKF